jgi:mersacidin/lichenicidin family type 2 lantibiotic
MDKSTITKAWTDEEFRAGLTEEARGMIPPSPAGAAALSDEFLKEFGGGLCGCTAVCCATCVCTRCCATCLATCLLTSLVDGGSDSDSDGDGS